MISLRPVGQGDDELLRAVYRSTREPELDVTGWDERQKHAFVQMQFDAQDWYYRQQYPDAAYDVVLIDGEAAGRLYVARSADELRIIDIALLPPFRGRGFGTSILEGLLREAADGAMKVSIHVEQVNPARRLYQRLGFAQVAERPPYILMEWHSAAQVNTAS